MSIQRSPSNNDPWAKVEMPSGRFPPPWSVEEQAACFVVRDHNEQALAYVCFEAVNIAKLPQRR
jgi:hypothetical protein